MKNILLVSIFVLTFAQAEIIRRVFEESRAIDDRSADLFCPNLCTNEGDWTFERWSMPGYCVCRGETFYRINILVMNYVF